MSESISEVIARVRRLNEAATPGPWFVSPLNADWVCHGDPLDSSRSFNVADCNDSWHDEDAALIASYRTDALTLADAVEEIGHGNGYKSAKFNGLNRHVYDLENRIRKLENELATARDALRIHSDMSGELSRGLQSMTVERDDALAEVAALKRSAQRSDDTAAMLGWRGGE